MTPVGLRPAVPDRRRPAARVAQVDAREPAHAVPVAGRRRASSSARRVVALGVPFWASGLCFALCAFVDDDDRCRSSCAARCVRQRRDRHGSVHGARRAVRAIAPPLRRLHRPPRHRADLPRLRRQRASSARSRCSSSLGEQVGVAPYTVQVHGAERHRRRRRSRWSRRTRAVDATASRSARMYPARWFFRGREDEPTTEVALRRGFADDLYIVLGGYEVETQDGDPRRSRSTRWSTGSGSASASWSFGTIIALLPERAFAFATSRVPEGAVTTSLMLLLLLSAARRRALHAQHVESAADGRRRAADRRSRRTCRARSSACAARAAASASASARAAMAAADARGARAAWSASGKTHDRDHRSTS